VNRFTRSIATAAAAVALLAVTACGGTTPAPAPADVPAAVEFIQSDYSDTPWVDAVTGATLADGTLTVHTDYPTGTDPDARALAKAICTAGKMYVMTRGTDAMDGTVTVEAADGLLLGHC
jgi:hypothetical protein